MPCARRADSMVACPRRPTQTLQYHVLRDDPLAALNVLRHA